MECSKYANTIYCNDCYLKSKHLHRNHTIQFLYSANGMCDCGDPDSLYVYCPEHSGPFKTQEQINDYISKIFSKEVLDKLNDFFGNLFLTFSKYLILTEKCEYFYSDSFEEKFKTKDSILNEKKEDIILLKNNFIVVFQNLMNFLRLISEKNIGMLHLIADYFLKNHFKNQKLEDIYKTTHRCLKITNNDIKLMNSYKEEHICICPFVRLFIVNYRDGMPCKDENHEFLYSFSHNLHLRNYFMISFFATYKQSLKNANEDFLINRNQFYLEDTTAFIAEKTHLIEESYDLVYQYFSKYFKSPELKYDSGAINENLIEKLSYVVFHLKTDTKYFSKPKIKKLMTEKTSIVKRVIDCICLIHNENELKSIVPHPKFQEKGFSLKFLELEIFLIGVVEGITIYIEWDKINELKDIFKYIINKIINQKKEGIKVLNENEYSYHLGLYRCFGLLLNSFCFNYAFNNKCTLIESIQFFKKTFFESKNEVENLVDIILKDYFKLFGFIAGGQNNFFNYYDSVLSYSRIYFLVKESYLIDFSLIKYLIVMKEKNIDIISYLKLSNLENVYSSFEKAFILTEEEKNKLTEKERLIEEQNKDKNIDNNNDNNNTQQQIDLNLIELLRNQNQRQMTNRVLQQFLYNNSQRNNDKSKDENDCLMQWIFLLDMIVIVMKDDSSPFYNLMRTYDDAISSQTKRDLFNKVKNNKFAMNDLKNILKEKLIQEIISQGNFTNLQEITKKIDKYLQTLFEDNNEFNKVLDELTYNKINGETKIIYLKDDFLKYLDFNYYMPTKEKSNAQRYILDFKKDDVKIYNYYYFNPSELTFEFFENVFEKILLNENNLEIMIKIIEKLLDNKKITEELDIKSIRNSLLPIVLKYLTMLSVINTESFILFKNKNNDLINKIIELLSNAIKNNKNNNILDKDLEENIKEVINQLIYHKIIFNFINSDLSKLDKYNYNTELIEKIRVNENDSKKNLNKINLIPDDNNKKNDNKKKAKNMKDKYKNLMKKKANIFMDKVNSNQEMTKAINEQNKKEEKINLDNEIMCFYCRNPIKLDSFEIPYGKIGLLIEDHFFINSIKSTIRSELSKIIPKDKNENEIYDKIIQSVYFDTYNRIISCGHYFHTSCFLVGCNKDNDGEFVCPLCLKNQNILIPPLNAFKEKNIFLKSEKLQELFNDKIDLNKYDSNKNESILFKDIIESFIEKINLGIPEDKNYIYFIDYRYPIFKAYFNFLENIFYINGTTFHKHQQIDTLQNIILSLRFIAKTNKSNISEIIKYIKNELTNLINGPDNNKKIYIFNYNEYMRYVNLLEKILLSLSILFNYDEIKQTFKYIIYIFLPYFSFGFYFRNLMLKKELENIDLNKFKEKLNITDLNIYLKDNNESILNYFNNFLKKLCLIKVLVDFPNKNDAIINSFNELTLDNILPLLDLDGLYKLLPKMKNNEINFFDFFSVLPKIFNKNDTFYNLFDNNFDYNKVFTNIFKNIKENMKEEESIYEKDLIIQFSPIKFDFIHLDNNIFDWIERNLGKPCDICKSVTKLSYICLICGDKVCHSSERPDEVCNHIRMCTEKYCIFVDMNNMNLVLWDKVGNSKHLYPIYVNSDGTGPKGLGIGNEFNLSLEKLILSIKNFVCDDF